MTTKEVDAGVTEIPLVSVIPKNLENVDGQGIAMRVFGLNISFRSSAPAKIIVVWGGDDMREKIAAELHGPPASLLLKHPPTMGNGLFVSRTIGAQVLFEEEISASMNCVDSSVFVVAEGSGSIVVRPLEKKGKLLPGLAVCVESKLAKELDTVLSGKKGAKKKRFGGK